MNDEKWRRASFARTASKADRLLLLSKEHAVHGIVRRASASNAERIDHLHQDSRDPNRHLLLNGDLSDGGMLMNRIPPVG